MRKNQYFKELKKQLKLYAVKESEDILKDYEEHFIEALNDGKTEEEICESLGNPENIAKQYINEEKTLKKKSHKKFLVLAIVFGIVMLYFGITTINLFFAKGPDSNIFWLKEKTVYYKEGEVLQITFQNVSLKNYENLELRIIATDKNTGSSHLLAPFKIRITYWGRITTKIKLDKYYYEDCELEVVYEGKDNKNYSITQERNYRPTKIMIIVDSVMFIVGISGFATFLPIYLVKRKNKKE